MFEHLNNYTFTPREQVLVLMGMHMADHLSEVTTAKLLGINRHDVRDLAIGLLANCNNITAGLHKRGATLHDALPTKPV